MAKYVTGGQVLQNMNTAGGINFKEILVQLKPDPQKGKTVKKLRLIGLPIEYWEASPRKRSEEDSTKTVQCPFPDAHLNKSFTRVCDDDPSKDIWTQMGYMKSRRYAVNCIDREDGKVKILSKGSSIFGEFYKTEKDNMEENLELVEAGESPLWTLIGGEEAPDVKIIATYNEKALGNVTYEVRFNPKVNKLTSEEIEQIKSVGCPTPEQLAAIRTNPDLADVPDWFFYGYDLEKIFKPAVLRTNDAAPTAPVSTPTEEMDIAVDDDDDDDFTTTAAAPVVINADASDDSSAPEELEEINW